MTPRTRSKGSLRTANSSGWLAAPVLAALMATGAFGAPLSLNEVLAKLDQNAAGFKSMSAKMERIDYTAVLKDSSKELGEIMLMKKKPGSVEMRIDFQSPDVKQISYADKKVQSYLPKINTVQIVDVGKIDAMISQGILIGFGTSSKDLQKAYSVKVLGEETVNGKASTRIELTPKSDSGLLKLKKIEVWLANADGYPVRQKLFQGSGDYNQATYSDLKINPALAANATKLNLPKDVKKEYPSK
jgi:outer membrane lipoprotein-sorting protein